MLAICCIAFFSCREERPVRTVERSFYYWRSVMNFRSNELAALQKLGINSVYVKFFDVDWEPTEQHAIPVAKLRNGGSGWPSSLRAIPVVFITNSCIQHADSNSVNTLAGNISTLVKDMSSSMNIPVVPELQIDCDWTAATKDVYFLLLTRIRKLNPGTVISATIRLHQVKYAGRTGIPPVDKGLLMCYNMGNLKNPATGNSIIEKEELEKYTRTLGNYPLALDVAFPIFNWKVLFRNNSFNGLLNELPDDVLAPALAEKKGNRYQILRDTLINGYDLRRGDILRDEQSDIAAVMSSAAVIDHSLKNTRLRVSLYHLDSVLLNKYSLHELENIFDRLR